MNLNPTPPEDTPIHGFDRTRCGCEMCRIPCKHVPGALDPEDLPRMCPENHDIFSWAEEHLRALTNKPYPTLVPARQANGSCHWHFDGLCAVHDVSPFGCAFFDSHMSYEEAEKRREATIASRLKDKDKKGLYYQVWQHLCRLGKIGRPGNRAGMRAEGQKLLRTIERRMGDLG